MTWHGCGNGKFEDKVLEPGCLRVHEVQMLETAPREAAGERVSSEGDREASRDLVAVALLLRVPKVEQVVHRRVLAAAGQPLHRVAVRNLAPRQHARDVQVQDAAS